MEKLPLIPHKTGKWLMYVQIKLKDGTLRNGEIALRG